MTSKDRRRRDRYYPYAGKRRLEVIQTGYGRYRTIDTGEDPEKEKARITRARLRFIISLTVIAVGSIVLMIIGGRDVGRPQADRLREITSFDEATFLYADEDTSAVGNIHRRFAGTGSMLPFNDGIVARYLFLEHPVEIWVGITIYQESASDAIALLLEETDPELNERSPWQNQTQFFDRGINITQVVGRGQKNYFYRVGNMVVWITADSTAASYALNAALNLDLPNWIASIRQGTP